MTNEKFTQGEWRDNKRPNGKVSIVGDDGQQVCLMWNSKERDANLSLISASKDMYRALKYLVEHECINDPSMHQECEQALAKARGEL